jgi:hypothetical protein
MPLTLKEDMTTICDEYQVNESDLIRKVIAQFITNIHRDWIAILIWSPILLE